MSQGKFTYDGKTLTLKNIVQCDRTIVAINRNLNIAVSKKYEAISFGRQDRISIRMESIARNEVFDYYDWWSWARTNDFSFALWEGEEYDTTVNSDAAASQTIIPVTTTSGFQVGHYCMIEEAGGDNFEVVLASSINGSNLIVSDTNLKHAYEDGDYFRNVFYWPKVMVEDDDFTLPLAGPGMYQDISINLIEVA